MRSVCPGWTLMCLLSFCEHGASSIGRLHPKQFDIAPDVVRPGCPDLARDQDRAEHGVGIELQRGDLAPRDGGAEAVQFNPNRVGRLTTSMPAAARLSRTLRMTCTAVGSSP